MLTVKKRTLNSNSSLEFLVPEAGLEPAWHAPYAPETYASTNFATRALLVRLTTRQRCCPAFQLFANLKSNVVFSIAGAKIGDIFEKSKFFHHFFLKNRVFRDIFPIFSLYLHPLTTKNNKNAMKFWLHLWFLLLALGAGFVLCFVVGFSTLALFDDKTLYVHLFQWAQNLLVMMAAPLWWTWFTYVRGQQSTTPGHPWRDTFHLLRLDRVDVRLLFLTFCMIVAAMPLLDTLEVFCTRLPYPQSIRDHALTEAQNNLQVMQWLLNPSSLQGWVEIILLMCLATGLGEEILFRGALLNCFQRQGRLNLHWSAVLVGLIFALIHFDLMGLLPRWLLGTMFVYLVYWTDSLWPAVLAHFINNAFALISYKMATPEELANIYNRDYSFSPIFIVLSIVTTGLFLWLIRRTGLQKQGC